MGYVISVMDVRLLIRVGSKLSRLSKKILLIVPDVLEICKFTYLANTYLIEFEVGII